MVGERDVFAGRATSRGHGTPLRSVCVLGLGRTGLMVASYLARRLGTEVGSVTLYGGASSQPNDDTRALEACGVTVVCGTEQIEGSYDLAVVSPGIPEGSAFFRSAQAHATELIGEPEFAWRESPWRWVAITGTNGKTTTTMLATELLRAGGLAAQAVGNVGTVVTGEVERRTEDTWFVAELSSFQLATTKCFHPRVAALLNVTPDHLEWHGSMEAYAAAKERAFALLDGDDLAIISDADSWCDAIAQRLEVRGVRVCRVSTKAVPEGACAAYVRDGMLTVRLDGVEHELASFDGMSLRGAHNAQNALVAAAIALELGVSNSAVAEGLMGFRPLEHRIEPCGEVGGVRFVNDSKATNVDAVQKALIAFEPGTVVVLLGGHDKATDLTDLAQAVSSQCRAAVCYGEAGPRLAKSLRSVGGSELAVAEAAHMEEALARAIELAVPGDTVLLSPACSSFDEFSSYKQRGTAFKRLVGKLVDEEGACHE